MANQPLDPAHVTLTNSKSGFDPSQIRAGATISPPFPGTCLRHDNLLVTLSRLHPDYCRNPLFDPEPVAYHSS